MQRGCLVDGGGGGDGLDPGGHTSSTLEFLSRAYRLLLRSL